MTDIQKYLKKLDVEPYYVAIGSIKKKARHFLTIELSFNRHNHLLVLTPEQVLVYEMGIFSTTTLREKVSLSDIQAIRVEKNEFFKNRTIYFENEKNIFRVRDLNDNEVDEFVKALMDITHVVPEGDVQTTRRTILSDSLLKSHDIPPTSVLASFSSDQAHLLMTALKLIALLPDGQVKQASLSDIAYLELRREAYQLELMVFMTQTIKKQGPVKPEYVLKFSHDCEGRLAAFCEQVNGITQRLQPRTPNQSTQGVKQETQFSNQKTQSAKQQTQPSNQKTHTQTFFSQVVSQDASGQVFSENISGNLPENFSQNMTQMFAEIFPPNFPQNFTQAASQSKSSRSQNTVFNSESQATQTDIPAKIKQLAELRDLGILTQEEFDAKKGIYSQECKRF